MLESNIKAMRIFVGYYIIFMFAVCFHSPFVWLITLCRQHPLADRLARALTWIGLYRSAKLDGVRRPLPWASTFPMST